ncbi:MAG: IPT/TIG domain-containing protein [Bryobacteraceae bacterium]
MAFRKSDPRPQILEVAPAAAIPGGEFQVRGKGFASSGQPQARFGDTPAPLVVGSDSYLIVKVPAGTTGDLIVGHNGESSPPRECAVGVEIAEGLHPVANPVVDRQGNVYSTFSGSPGQKTPVSIYRVDPTGQSIPYVTDLMNATGLALDQDDILYASSRNSGIVYRITSAGNMVTYIEGMGVATGMVFDNEDNLFVGDRSGTIFKVSRQRQIYVFATLEPSIAAYHIAFGPDGHLYVTGPTTSSYDSIHRIAPDGRVELFYRGLGRPQGLAFDSRGNLYVAASYGGRRGIVRLTPDAKPELFLSGPSIVGLAFTPDRHMILATNSSLYRVNVGIEGRRIP